MFRNRYYTVMVVPSATSKVTKLKVSGRFLQAAAALASVAVALSGYLAYDYFRVKGQVGELEKLRVESREQRLKLNSFAQQVIDVEKEMVRLRKLDSMLRSAFDMDKGPATKRIGGQGGGANPELAASPELLGGAVEELTQQMGRDLGRLKGETGAQEASLGELVSFLQEKRSLMMATPSIWPVRGLVTSGFRRRHDPFTGRAEFHSGLDIAAPEGSPLLAPADGVVVRVAREVGSGRILRIDHGFGFATSFAHNSRIVVEPGQRVKRGQVVAYVGNTGRSTGPHVHYEVVKNGIPVNPANFILD